MFEQGGVLWGAGTKETAAARAGNPKLAGTHPVACRLSWHCSSKTQGVAQAGEACELSRLGENNNRSTATLVNAVESMAVAPTQCHPCRQQPAGAQTQRRQP